MMDDLLKFFIATGNFENKNNSSRGLTNNDNFGFNDTSRDSYGTENNGDFSTDCDEESDDDCEDDCEDC